MTDVALHRSAAASAGDTWVIARRGLLHMRRQPEALTDATIQPIMFVLLFAFVFGGAIAVPGGGSYREFLMGGIFAQTIFFGAFGVAIALADDRTNGAIDRFHSLPIARSERARRPRRREPRQVAAADHADVDHGLPRRLADPHRPARRDRGLRADVRASRSR